MSNAKPTMLNAIQKMLDGLKLEPCEKPEGVPDGEPYPTHKGVIRMGKMLPGGNDLTVYQLSDGRRVIDAVDIARAFGMVPAQQVHHNQASNTPPRSN